MATRPLAWTFASLFVVAAAACGGSSEEALSDGEVESAAVSSPSAPSRAAAISRRCPPRGSRWRSIIPRRRCSKQSAARRNTLSHREVKATRLVEAQVGDEVTCRDNGAVNTKLRPEYPVGYSCFNEDGDFYAAVVSADGALTSLRGPVRLKPPGS